MSFWSGVTPRTPWWKSFGGRRIPGVGNLPAGHWQCWSAQGAVWQAQHLQPGDVQSDQVNQYERAPRDWKWEPKDRKGWLGVGGGVWSSGVTLCLRFLLKRMSTRHGARRRWFCQRKGSILHKPRRRKKQLKSKACPRRRKRGGRIQRIQGSRGQEQIVQTKARRFTVGSGVKCLRWDWEQKKLGEGSRGSRVGKSNESINDQERRWEWGKHLVVSLWFLKP